MLFVSASLLGWDTPCVCTSHGPKFSFELSRLLCCREGQAKVMLRFL
jgi:hypothetical protein